MERFDQGLGMAATLFRAAANFCLLFLLGANGLNIVLRGVFGLSPGWVFPWSMVVFVWMVFFGFFVYVRAGRDIGILFLVRRLPSGIRRAVALLAQIIVLGVIALVLTTLPTQMAVQAGMMEMVDLDRRALSIPLFLSSGLIALQVMFNIWRIVTGRLEAFATDHDVESAETTGAST